MAQALHWAQVWKAAGVQGQREQESLNPSSGQPADLGAHLQRESRAQQYRWWFEPFSAECETWGKWFRQQWQSTSSSGRTGKVTLLILFCITYAGTNSRFMEKYQAWVAFSPPLPFSDINDLCLNLSSQSITQWHQLHHSHARNTGLKSPESLSQPLLIHKETES